MAVTASKLQRVELVQALLDLAGAQPGMEGVELHPGWPGQNMPREAIWLYNIEGQLSFPFLMAGPKSYDDEFELTFRCLSRSAGVDRLVPFAAVELYLNAIAEALRQDGQIGGRVDGVVQVLPGEVKGPFLSPNTMGDVGWEAHAEFHIHCQIRVQ